MKIYLSGPIQGYDISERYRFFKTAAAELIAAGHEVVNPFNVDSPHEPCAEDGVYHTWSCYLRYDIIEMLKCDAIKLLPGWEKSPGARLELHVAASCGLEVLT